MGSHAMHTSATHGVISTSQTASAHLLSQKRLCVAVIMT